MMTDADWEEADRYFTCANFMVLFKERPEEVINILRSSFPQEAQALRIKLDSLPESKTTCRLLQDY